MGINSVNNGSGVVWNSNTTQIKGEKVEAANYAKPANTDKLVLNLPKSETVYKRQEFVTDERMGEGCAFCYTYMERTLTFAGEKYGALTLKSDGGYFIINADKTKQTFGKSGSEMKDIGHAVEETWERRDRALEQSTVSGGIAGDGGSVGFVGQSTTYRYSSVSETKGTLAFKNGETGSYRGTAFKLTAYNYSDIASIVEKIFAAENTQASLGFRDV